MAKGNEAKENLIQNFIKSAGENYQGCVDKKYYFLAEENGEKIQIAVTLTCPKTEVAFDGGITTTVKKVENAGAVEFSTVTDISEEEKQNIADLLDRLGLS